MQYAIVDLMNKELLRKADYFLMLGLAIFCVFGNVTGLQLFPLGLFALLGYMQLYGKKDVRLWIIILSALMIVINLSVSSLADLVVWLFTLIVFAI